MLMLLMQLAGQSAISCTTDPSQPTPARHLIEVSVDSGRVEVTGWDRDSIDLQLSAADLRIVERRREPNHLAVCKRPTGPGRESPPVIVRLRVPRDSRVQVNTRHAAVRVMGVTGAHVRSRTGTVAVDSVTGRVEVHSQLGAITLRTLGGAVRVDATAGSVTTHGITGPLEVTTNAGEVRVLDNASPSVTIASGPGNITLAGALLRNGTYRLRTDRGNVEVRPVEPFHADLTAGTVRGRLQWRFGQNSSDENPPQPGKRTEVRFGDGGATIHITTLSGAINVH